MGHISDSDIQRVRDATDIVELIGERSRIQPRGREAWCCCPLHNEKTPSFKIDPSTQLWHCFGCGEGGDIFAFIMKIDELSFPEAVRKLADRAHIEISSDAEGGISRSEKQRLRDVCKAAKEFFHLQLMRSPADKPAEARRYLSERGFGGDIPKTWELGFAPGRGALSQHLLSLGFKADELITANVSVQKNGRLQDRFYDRVMFPIHDISGECIAFGGRIVDQGEPKYLNSQETPLFHKSQVLFGLDKAKAAMTSSGCAIIAEGYTDVIAMHKAGITNCVATLGTALTKNHIRLLARHAGKKIVYLFDGDAAGQRATERALQFIDDSSTVESGRTPLEICALCLPHSQDPAEFLAEHSAAELQELIDNATPLVRFGIERKLSQHDLTTAEGRAKALPDALSVLAPINTSILAKEYAVELAQRLQFRETDVLEQLARIQKPRVSYESEPEVFTPDTSSTPEKQPPSLSQQDSNLYALEKELLCLVVTYPLEALSYIDDIAQRSWKFPLHGKIASAVIAELSDNLAATPAQLVKAGSLVDASAAALLTSGSSLSQENVDTLFEYLLLELSIADLDSEAARLKSSMVSVEKGSAEEANFFKQLVAVQDKISELQKTRKSYI